MDIPKKISQISKDINHVKQMEVNKFIQELLTAELKAQKNAKNKRFNQVNKFIQELLTAELKAQKNAKNKRFNQVKLQKKKLK